MLDCTRGKYCLDIYLNIYINEEKINSTVTVIVFALVFVYKTDNITYYTKLPNDVTLRFVRKMVSIHLTAFTFSFSLSVCVVDDDFEKCVVSQTINCFNASM